MGAISNDWLAPLSGEFKKPYYRKLYDTVKREYETHVVYPDANDIFNAFDFTPLSEVKVVILGQDPYHGPGQAHGLCFSVKPDVEIPPSLVNIYQELHDDLGCYIPNNGYLTKWAKQGVMLLNTVLTVRAHQANSHRGIGWEKFTVPGRTLRFILSRALTPGKLFDTPGISNLYSAIPFSPFIKSGVPSAHPTLYSLPCRGVICS